MLLTQGVQSNIRRSSGRGRFSGALLPAGYMGLWPRCPDVPDQQGTSRSCRRASRRMRGHYAALDMYIVEIPELSAKVVWG